MAAPGGAPGGAPGDLTHENTAGYELLNDFDAAMLQNNIQNGISARMLVYKGDMALKTEIGNLDSLTAQIEDLATSEGN